MRNKNQIVVIVKKELTALFRDKRNLFVVLLLPFFLAPCVMTVADYATSKSEKDTIFRIAVDESLQDLQPALNEIDNFQLSAIAEQNAVEMIRSEEIDVFLSADEKKESVTLQYNSASTHSARAVSVVKEVLESIQKQNLQSRLHDLYNVPYEMSCPEFEIQFVDVYGSEQGSMIILLIPMIILSYCCYGVSTIAGEMTIAEKEHQTWDPLLSTGISRHRLIFGKNIVAIVSGWISGVLAFSGLYLYSRVIKNTTIVFSAKSITLLLFVSLLLAVFFSEISILIGLVVKSFKEYQAFTSLMSILSMLPAFFAMNVGSGSTPVAYYAVPLVSNTVLIKEILTNSFNYTHGLIVLASTLVISVGCWIFAVSVIRKKQ